MRDSRFVQSKARSSILWQQWIKPLVVTILILCTFRSAIADWYLVPTRSMNPTIIPGDRVFTNKMAYGLKIPFTKQTLLSWDGPKRSDVVVFYSPDNPDRRLVKRVIGLPGDRIALINNRLFVNDQPIDYRKLDADELNQANDCLHQYRYATEMLGDNPHPVMVTLGIESRRSFSTVTIPANHYFVMGDNRDNSADSRKFGSVHRDLIIGQATRVIISLDDQRNYLPRMNRLFKPLP